MTPLDLKICLIAVISQTFSKCTSNVSTLLQAHFSFILKLNYILCETKKYPMKLPDECSFTSCVNIETRKLMFDGHDGFTIIRRLPLPYRMRNYNL